MTDRRLRSETLTLNLSANGRVYPFDVSLAYDDDYRLHEVVFVGGQKVGTDLEMMFHDLGIQLSRAIQGRDPETGVPL